MTNQKNHYLHTVLYVVFFAILFLISYTEILPLRIMNASPMPLIAAVVTVAFYFILGYFNTANLVVSTLSVTTSFVAAYLTMRRSPFYAFAYMLNDVVLIVLWILASISDISYLSVIICFVMFLFNDLYSFTNWKRMQKRQANGE